MKPGDFTAESHEVARALIGATLLVDGVGGRIVETEAYDRDDPGLAQLFGTYGAQPGHVRPARPGLCVPLLRHPLVPEFRLPRRRSRRRGADPGPRTVAGTGASCASAAACEDVRLLCSGPGRVGQALGITRELNGRRLDQPPFQVAPGRAPARSGQGPAHRHLQGEGGALALRTEGFTLPQPPLCLSPQSFVTCGRDAQRALPVENSIASESSDLNSASHRRIV